MRTLLALLAASTLIGGCGCAEVNYLRVDEPVPAATQPTTVEDTRINPGMFVFPDADGAEADEQCSTVYGGSVRCGDMLNLCIPPRDASQMWTAAFMPSLFGCEGAAIAWDVCQTRPEVEWPVYGLTPEECAEAPAGPRP